MFLVDKDDGDTEFLPFLNDHELDAFNTSMP